MALGQINLLSVSRQITLWLMRYGDVGRQVVKGRVLNNDYDAMNNEKLRVCFSGRKSCQVLGENFRIIYLKTLTIINLNFCFVFNLLIAHAHYCTWGVTQHYCVPCVAHTPSFAA